TSCFIPLHGKVATVSEGIEQLCEEVRIKGNCSSQSTLNYVITKTDEESEKVMLLIEFDLGSRHYRVTLEQLAEQWNLVYHEAKFTGGITTDEEWGEYNRLVGLQSLQYEDPHMNAR
ncbi:hypothetical protein S83_013593, partial [Arachis hypogaea]